jgi:hypothetical protein
MKYEILERLKVALERLYDIDDAARRGNQTHHGSLMKLRETERLIAILDKEMDSRNELLPL